MDRCALFVDAGYVLADGAMVVHGTRRRESVSWDHEGLVQLLCNLATERSGLPLLRCYWYEATVDGRRNEEHDSIADLPGVKVRLAKIRPGRREGVESEIRRDLTTLARNNAVSDALVITAEEDLAQAVADVQDLGMRVTLLHIPVDGNSTISRALRQECDDIAEIKSEHLRPYVDLISGAEPPRPDEQEGALTGTRPEVNGRAPGGYTPDYAPARAVAANGYQDIPPAYAAAPYEEPPAGERAPSQPAQDSPPPQQDLFAALAQMPVKQPELAGPGQEADAPRLEVPAPQVSEEPQEPARQDLYATPVAMPAPADDTTAPVAVPAPVATPAPVDDRPVDTRALAAPDWSGYIPGAPRESYARDMLPGEVSAEDLQPVPAAAGSAQARRLPARRPGFTAPPEAQPAPMQQAAAQMATEQLSAREPVSAQPVSAQPVSAQPVAGQPVAGQPPVEQDRAERLSAAATPLVPTYTPAPNGPYSGTQPGIQAWQPDPAGMPGPPGPGQAGSGQPGYAQPSPGQPGPGQPGGQPWPGQSAAGQAGAGVAGLPPAPPPLLAGIPGTMGSPEPGNAYGQASPRAPIDVPAPPGAPGPISAPGSMVAGGQPNPMTGPGPLSPVGGGMAGGGMAGFPVSGQPGLVVPDAVQSAHEEGLEFGSSVARDAPALWLEAVLARKPRMPSDLEARLLQGSSLPIDFLLHDEVRHALRRGFWDALERARR